MKHTRGFLVSLLLFAALPCLARLQDPGGTSPNNTKPATPSANSQAISTSQKKPKKVWTNDDLASTKGTVSVVGDPDPSSRNEGDKKPSTSAEANTVHDAQLKDYRNQMLDLETKIDAIDKEISQLKNFKGENTSPSGGLNPNQGYNMVPIEDQVKQLEERKKQLQSKIDDVDSEARKNGIEPGELR